jgi:uncharacterized damage-inducible protein DinB
MPEREATVTARNDAVTAILDQLRRTQNDDPWYGTPRARFLEGLSADDAARRPPGVAHSMWELVLHMTAWSDEVRRRLGGAEPGTPEEGDWPPVDDVSEIAWERAKARLAAAHTALLAEAERLSPAELARCVGTVRDPELGTGVTYAGLLVGLAQHDAYHTGQLALLRRLTEAANTAR